MANVNNVATFLAAVNNLAAENDLTGFIAAVNNLSDANNVADGNNLAAILAAANILAAGNNPYRNFGNDAPGTWRVLDTAHCCIYRVPSEIRQGNPQAYTPHLVIIGPLHYRSIVVARESRGVIRNVQAMNYLNMEAQKVIYRAAFEGRVNDANTIQLLRTAINTNEQRIRDSYSESTDWIPQQEFAEMVYTDSLFILEFLLRIFIKKQTRQEDLPMYPREDPLTIPSLEVTIMKDLMLLENQLPYFILGNLFHIARNRIGQQNTELRTLVNFFFYISPPGDIKHFTDLLRLHHVATLGEHCRGGPNPLGHMYNASKLISGGVDLATWREGPSMAARFEDGRLEIPLFNFDGKTEVNLRNIMALEQCYYPNEAYVCNYIIFLDRLIDTEKDVEVLVKRGILTRAADNVAVANILNRITGGLMLSGSYLADVATNVNNCYDENEKRYNDCLPFLKRTYFFNWWGGTATVVATLILISTVGAFIVALIEATN